MLRLKFITSFDHENRITKVYFDAEWEEYIVRLLVDQQVIPNATYHTDDSEDAINTAKEMVKC